jgi:6-phosphofructokinase 1
MSQSKSIGFLTSGGDSPGMNAAIRSIVRTSLHHGWKPHAIYDGFSGLISGNIKPIGWEDVTFILSQGGTVIRSSRCPEFTKLESRKKAVLNLASRGIHNLIVIGGDGSLTGAECLRSEWSDHVTQLITEGLLESDAANRPFSIIGIIGSIDNDMWGTEITIGSNTSLHRIIESLDNITSTALSHSRAFVIEVMGRDCGWLALNAAIAVGADWVFIPEKPPGKNWVEEMVTQLKKV